MTLRRVVWPRPPCGMCGKEFLLNPSTYRSRLKRAKSGKIFCSKECSAAHMSAAREAEYESLKREQMFHVEQE